MVWDVRFISCHQPSGTHSRVVNGWNACSSTPISDHDDGYTTCSVVSGTKWKGQIFLWNDYVVA